VTSIYQDANALIDTGYDSIDRLVALAATEPRFSTLVGPVTAARDSITAAAKVLTMLTPVPHEAGLAATGMTIDSGHSVGIRTCNVHWRDLQKTAGGDLIRPNDIDRAFELGGPVRVRPMFGRYSPQFAFDATQGGVAIIDPATSKSVPCIRWWDARVQPLMADLIDKLADEYDGEIGTIFNGIPAAAAQAEPLLRYTHSATNRQALVAAGYTAELDRQSYEASFQMMAAFKRSNIAMSFDPWQYVKPDGTFGSDAQYPVALMDRMAALYGPRAVWQVNSAKSVPLKPYAPIYAKMKGSVSSYMTTPRPGSFKLTLDWAVAQGAILVELQQGYATELTAAQCAAYDDALKKNLTKLIAAGTVLA
jgi:hypothetical protein